MKTGPDTSRSMIILDDDAVWNKPGFRIVYWAEFDVPDGSDSMPLLVEKQAAELRKEYLSFVHDLGEYRLRGRSLREHLRLDEGFSFWWMTLIAEKAPMRGTGIYKLFKLRALERLYLISGCEGIVLCSTDQALHQVLSSWCRNMDHSYRWYRDSKPRRRPTTGGWFRQLPLPVQAIGTLLRMLWMRLKCVKPKRKSSAVGKQATVVTYFPNIDHGLAQQGVFRSRYWEGLHDILKQGSWAINWIFLYVQNEQCSFKEAIALRRRFEQNLHSRDRYYFLTEFMNVRVILDAVRTYLRLMLLSLTLRSALLTSRFSGSSLNLWPILAKDWNASLRGPHAMEGSLMLSLFQRMVRTLPSQELGLYLWENQTWEKGLIHAWRKIQGSKLIGYQHSTLCFLDLRSFEDSRSYTLTAYPPLLPDVLAVNGRGAADLLLDVGFPKERLREVEAVRYTYLNQYNLPVASDVKTEADKRNLLVVTGYMPSETADQLRLLGQVEEQGGLKEYSTIMVKPHPYCPVEGILQDVAPVLDIEIVKKPLTLLWQQASVVYTANSTSAALEAAVLGLPLLIHQHARNLNLNPLVGLPTVNFVARTKDLINSLNSLRPTSIRQDYVCLDQRLSRWRSLLHDLESC